jgi:uncharacterized protein (DUF1800 family)
MRLATAVVLALTFVPLCAQNQTPRKSARSTAAKPVKRAAKEPPLVSLNPRERAVQLLNRFTFGARPGDVDRVLAMGTDKWLEQQLNPDSIDDSALAKRLADYPTLTMTPEEALTAFPDRGTIRAIADEKLHPPTDPYLAAVYEVQLQKLYRENLDKKVEGNSSTQTPSDTELAEQKKRDQATAARIAGTLFALPRDQRMNALLKMPVTDRIAFTTYVAGDQRNLLLSQFTPREREIFNAMAANVGSSGQIANELSQAKLLRAIVSERQLQEVMTDFWFNHFNVYIGKDSDQWYTTSYERDVIRKHALGKFRDLLVATATSPAMMVYLDNWQSIGPDSIANGINPLNPRAKRGNRGLNENYGRELMELHTVGVNGGYTQADVTALSAILTGWTVDRPHQAGPFTYEPRRHEPGPKQWFGHTIDASTAPTQPNTPPGMNEGFQALTILAGSPKTAHFISYKIAQRFVADDPPPELVDRLAATFLSTDGDMKAVLRTLAQSPEFNSKKYFRNKIKTPLEFVASAFRTTATDPANPGALVQTLRTMGMPLYYALPPTGYYITADRWMNSAALVDRLNFAYSLTSSKFANQKFDSAHVLALGLMSQPSIFPEAAPSSSSRPHLTEASLTQASIPLTGPDFALHVLESSLVGGEVSAKTNDLIHQQMAKLTTSTTQPTDTLNLLTALVMGSPEFQLR